MKERYDVVHKLYPNYLLFFLKKGKLYSFGETKELINMFGEDALTNVNKIVIDNLEIVEKVEYENNMYMLFLCKLKLCAFLEEF